MSRQLIESCVSQVFAALDQSAGSLCGNGSLQAESLPLACYWHMYLARILEAHLPVAAGH